jgi:hypothetical protein
MRVFVVRPFGEKEGIDFDRVERELVQPALRRLGDLGIDVAGGTTGEIARQGNIREDMFRLLVIADLVIADVSIHNANVFYELGIRHALRPCCTFLMRSQTDHAYPFDLQTDRYFLYDAADPAARVEGLAQALRATLGAAARRDSPIFQLLPNLQPHGRQQLVTVPADFAADVELAHRTGDRGMLRLFAHEVQSGEWDQEGLRLIGEAQFKLRAFRGARDTFEALQRAAPDDVKTNQRLATIYQRLTLGTPPEGREDLRTRSDQAIRRALASSTTVAERAEAYALAASNAKARWMDEMQSAAEPDRQAVALRSPHFQEMLELYLKAANLDLNAHYPAVNALGMLSTQVRLGRMLADAWQDAFDDEAAAQADLKARETLTSRLTSSLALALEMDDVMGKREGAVDPWAASSRADLLLFTAPDRPRRIAQAYRLALAETDRFTLEATRRNLGPFKELGLFEPGLSAALEVVDDAIAKSDPPRAAPDRVILFTGHMVDAPDRPAEQRRFPRTREAEARARALIEAAVRAEREAGGAVVGIAGGACGGDILFHEVCRDAGVPTRLLLALPRERFQVTSVQHGGPDWVERYHALCDRLSPAVLQQTEALPGWLADRPGYDVWQRNNLWLMFSALADNARRLTLIALYNPERDPAGPGGTAHLVDEARRWGFKSVQLDARALLAE